MWCLFFPLRSCKALSIRHIYITSYYVKHFMTGPKGKSEFCFPDGDPQCRSRGNKTHCFPRHQSLSVLLNLPTQKYNKNLRRNRLFYAGWLKNLPRFQGARPDHVRVQSSCCCFPRELVNFGPRHVTRYYYSQTSIKDVRAKIFLSI